MAKVPFHSTCPRAAMPVRSSRTAPRPCPSRHMVVCFSHRKTSLKARWGRIGGPTPVAGSANDIPAGLGRMI